MKIAVPNKGRLHEPTISLLERAGLHIENGANRKLYADTVDPEVSILYVRAADIPRIVALERRVQGGTVVVACVCLMVAGVARRCEPD